MLKNLIVSGNTVRQTCSISVATTTTSKQVDLDISIDGTWSGLFLATTRVTFPSQNKSQFSFTRTEPSLMLSVKGTNQSFKK